MCGVHRKWVQVEECEVYTFGESGGVHLLVYVYVGSIDFMCRFEMIIMFLSTSAVFSCIYVIF